MEKVASSKTVRYWLAAMLVAALAAGAISVSVRDDGGGPLGVGTVVLTLGPETAEASADIDYACDGTDDSDQFAAALAALPATGGEIHLLTGTYDFSANCTRAIDDVKVTGTGWGTVVSGVASPPITAGGDGWQFRDIKFSNAPSVAGKADWQYLNIYDGSTGWGYRDAYTSIAYSGQIDATSASITAFGADTVTTGSLTVTGSVNFTGADLIGVAGTSGSPVRTADVLVVAYNAPDGIYPTTTNTNTQVFVCTGVNDDVTLEDAATACGAYGFMQVTSGSYILGGAFDLMPEGIWLNGMGSSSEFVGDGTNVVIQTNNNTQFQKITSIKVNGSSTCNGVGDAGIDFNNNYGYVGNVEITACGGHAIEMSNGYSWLVNSYIHDTYEYGVYTCAGSGFHHIVNNKIYGTTNTVLDPTVGINGITGYSVVAGNIIDGFDIGISANKGWNTTNNQILNCGQYGIKLANIDIACSANALYGNGWLSNPTSATYAQMVLTANADYCTVGTNTFDFNFTGGTPAAYGIWLQTGANKNSVKGNTEAQRGLIPAFYDSSLTAIYDQGSDNDITGNPMWITENWGTAIMDASCKAIAHGLDATPTSITLGLWNSSCTICASADTTNIYISGPTSATVSWQALVR